MKGKVRLVALAFFVLTGTVHAQDAIDLSSAHVMRSAPDVALWPITTAITELTLGAADCNVEFSMKEAWPNVLIPGWNGGSIAYTLWMVRIVGGEVYTGGGIEFWTGRRGGCGPAANYIQNWYYDGSWGPLNTAGELTPGERVGFFVTAGDARAKDVRTVTARSAVVAVPWPGGTGGTFRFDAPAPPVTPPPVIVPPPVQPPPVQPTPIQPPPVVTVPDPTAAPLLVQAVEILKHIDATSTDTNTKVTEIHGEVRTFAQQFGSVMAFVGKYIAPALGGWIATWAVMRQPDQPVTGAAK